MSIWAAAKGDGGSFAYISGGVTHEHYLSPPGKQPATHKPLLLWHRWDKINQLLHPCPRTPLLLPCYTAGLHADGEPSPNLGNRPLIVSPLTWPLGLGTPALSPQSSGLLLLQGWGLGARGAHVYGGACSVQGCTHVRPAPSLPVHPRPPPMSLSVKSRKKGHHKKGPCMLYAHALDTHTPGGSETPLIYTRPMRSGYYCTQARWSLLRRSSKKIAQILSSLDESMEEG